MDTFTGVRSAQGRDQNDREGTGSRTMSLIFHLYFHFLLVALLPVWSSPLASAYRTPLFIQDLTQVFSQVYPDYMVVSTNLLLPSQIPEGVSCTRRRSPRDQLLTEAEDGEEKESLGI